MSFLEDLQNALGQISNGGTVEVPYVGEGEEIVPIFDEFISGCRKDGVMGRINQATKVAKLTKKGKTPAPAPAPAPAEEEKKEPSESRFASWEILKGKSTEQEEN